MTEVKEIRQMSTVVMNEDKKTALLKDIEEFSMTKLMGGIRGVAFLTEGGSCCMDLPGLESPV